MIFFTRTEKKKNIELSTYVMGCLSLPLGAELLVVYVPTSTPPYGHEWVPRVSLDNHNRNLPSAWHGPFDIPQGMDVGASSEGLSQETPLSNQHPNITMVCPIWISGVAA